MSKCYRKPPPFQEKKHKILNRVTHTTEVTPAFLGSYGGTRRKDTDFSSYDQSLETCYLETTQLIFSEDCLNFLLFQPAAVWMNAVLLPAASSCLLPLLCVCSSRDQTQDFTHGRQVSCHRATSPALLLTAGESPPLS